MPIGYAALTINISRTSRIILKSSAGGRSFKTFSAIPIVKAQVVLGCSFLSCGGVVEVLALKRDNFKIQVGEGLIINFIKTI